MKVIKAINTNAAICVDDDNNELVALGKGIGFPKCPYELTDLNVIQRTFYDVDPSNYDLIKELPEDVLRISADLVDMYMMKSNDVTPNLVFTLADHLAFAIKRVKENMALNYPLRYDVQHLYEAEYKLGKYAVDRIKKEMKVYLPKEEAGNIAIHFINSGVSSEQSKRNYNDKVVDQITEIVSRHYGLYIDRDGFNYSRFVSHILYLLKRENIESQISSDNNALFEDVKKNYPEAFSCVEKISTYMKEELDQYMNNEEKLYLMLHVNRLCTRENQK